MIPNKDVIARAANGRYFALTKANALRYLEENEFCHTTYYKRVDLMFANPKRKNNFGVPLVSLYYQNALIIYSFEESFRPTQAERLFSLALTEIAALDREYSPEGKREASVSFRAYLGPLGKLTITQRIRIATKSKYSLGNKFSNAFKPRGVRTDEKVIREISLL